jgi:NAD+ synthase (glutamine-hydrolysing)
VRSGRTKEQILCLANIAFKDSYLPEEILKWLDLFLKRFLKNQFKRNCMPDGPKIGSVCLSPRRDFNMPSDAQDA